MRIILFSSIIIGVVIMMSFKSIAPAGAYQEHFMAGRLERSPNFKDGQFAGGADALTMSAADYVSTTWEYLFSCNNRTPESPLPIKPVDLTPFSAGKHHRLYVTWLGHSTLMINVDGFKILTDPVFEPCVSVLGPKRYSGEVPLNPDTLPQMDIVIISHDHYDHLNKSSIRRLRDKTRIFAVPLGVGVRLLKWGVAQRKIVELDWWEEYPLDEALMVAATPAQHFSGRGIADRNKTLWASWVISTPLHRLFFSGDSGYFNGFKQVGDKYGPFDMTFIECGAYGTAWPQVHMFPEQTVQAHLDLRGRLLQPIHWGTFNLALHPWYEPMERLTAAAGDNIPVVTPVAGETILYGKTTGTPNWWRHAMEGHQRKYTNKKTAQLKARESNR